MSFPIYLRAVFRIFGYLQYSEIIYLFSEEYVSIWEENQDMNIVCIYECAYEEVKKKILWANFGIRYKTHVVEICHSAVQKDKTCWVPYASLSSAKYLQDLPAEGRRGKHLRMLLLPANAELLIVFCLKDGWLQSTALLSSFLLSDCLGDMKDWLSDLQRSRMDRRLFTLALIPFPLSRSVIICVDQMLLGYLCLTLQLDALYLSLCIDYIKNIPTSSTTSCVKIVSRGSDCTFYCLRRCLEFSSFYFQYILFAFIILYVLSGALLL